MRFRMNDVLAQLDEALREFASSNPVKGDGWLKSVQGAPKAPRQAGAYIEGDDVLEIDGKGQEWVTYTVDLLLPDSECDRSAEWLEALRDKLDPTSFGCGSLPAFCSLARADLGWAYTRVLYGIRVLVNVMTDGI